ncbi:hypothetical protein T03_10271 [Trichinella britovi]|uniref:DDE-1 domain-containing protein n=1 Tax=Trichinella britovi TaxID=45882 RepID=A0A0V1CHK0_TRIBR|nr:hypothetical protein T03_10271 [Trichinella britovi]
MLLIIDNAPCHPSCELLDCENGMFKMLMETILCHYLNLNLNLKNSCYMIAHACDSILGSTLPASWNKLFGYNEKCKFKLSPAKVEQWLADDDTPLFVTLTDDEILKAVVKDENKDIDVSDIPDKLDTNPNHKEAYSCIKVGFK